MLGGSDGDIDIAPGKQAARPAPSQYAGTGVRAGVSDPAPPTAWGLVAGLALIVAPLALLAANAGYAWALDTDGPGRNPSPAGQVPGMPLPRCGVMAGHRSAWRHARVQAVAAARRVR